MTRKSWATSPASRLDVGSSRTRTFAEMSMARAIATSCWTAIENVSSCAVTSIVRSSRRRISSERRRISAHRIRPRVRGSRPMKMFSATERFGQRLTSWYSVLIPCCCACSGPVKATGAPSSVISPRSIS
jgi:hypothetical protein